jgi:ferredoxin/flavodoxin---NADP+ reductase
MRKPEVAIVGGGPSGFFAAEALLKSDVDARVVMFERLPTPYGLVRSGVAPDHQQIKQVVKVFEAIASHPRFDFFGNIEIGLDTTIDELRGGYDAIILTYGASAGIGLSIPGSELPQNLTAADFVGWYNGHPDFAEVKPSFDHETAVVVGNGNVAIDVARILLCDHVRLAKTDMADHALEALRQSRVRQVHIVGRKGPLQASFTTAELRELLGLPGVRVVVDPKAMALDDADRAYLELPANAVKLRNFNAIKDAMRRCDEPGSKELHLHFFASPVEVEGIDRVAGVRFVRNRSETTVGTQMAILDQRHFSIQAGLAVASIGFRGQPMQGVPFDGKRGVVPNIDGRVVGAPERGAPLYVAGWIKRGASGIIGTNRADAAQTVRAMLADFREGRWPVRIGAMQPSPSPRNAVDFAGWKRIDEIERNAGQKSGRPRRKVVTVEEMIGITEHKAESCNRDEGRVGAVFVAFD